jgi:zinc transport system substrate-binding protein
MYVKVGTAIEFELAWIDRLTSANKKMLLKNASRGINLANAEHDMAHGREEQSYHGSRHNHSSDPHIWLSPRNAKIMVENICDGLVSVDPANRDYYTANRQEYLREIDSLDVDISEMLNVKSNRKFMVYHPAWGWFARDYDLEQIPVEVDAKEPTAQGIRRLVEEADRHGIRTIFASPQFSTRSIEAIAREIEGHVVLIDPLAKNYVDNLRQVAQTLADAMR